MKIIHISEFCPGISIGGTENYISELIKELNKNGIQNIVAWLCKEDLNNSFYTSGTKVVPVPLSSYRYTKVNKNYSHFTISNILNTQNPDVLHFHTFGRSEAAFAKKAYHLGIPYVFTYHCPGLSCRRETLLKWGKDKCDGIVRVWRCSACVIQQRLKCNIPIAWLTAITLFPVGFLGRFFKGKVQRVTSYVEDMFYFRKDFRIFLKQGPPGCIWTSGS